MQRLLLRYDPEGHAGRAGAERRGASSAPTALHCTEQVDMWSLGCILFVMLAAYHPFDPEGELADDALWKNIQKGYFDFEDEAWELVGGPVIYETFLDTCRPACAELTHGGLKSDDKG